MTIRKGHPFLGNSVNIRSSNLRFLIQGRNITETLIIRHDENDVRVRCSSEMARGYSTIQHGAEYRSEVSHKESHKVFIREAIVAGF